jgi:hypothetical protein
VIDGLCDDVVKILDIMSFKLSKLQNQTELINNDIAEEFTSHPSVVNGN